MCLIRFNRSCTHFFVLFIQQQQKSEGQHTKNNFHTNMSIRAVS